jgi:peptide/nickel transport system ATP-binding protein
MSVDTKELTTAKVHGDHSDALLSVQDLRVWFELRKFGFGHAGYVHAVDGVSFDLGHAESIAVVGESGCGKSTLMKAILALHKPTKGEIVFDGKKLSEMDSKDIHWYRSQVGYVQQDPYGALAPFMNIKKILEEPLIIGGVSSKEEREQRVRADMEEVKLYPVEDYWDKYPHMLSGGQQQRVVIARAMTMEPKLLVADEPVSMLDASVRVEILKLFQGLQQKHNLSVIYITHDLATVSYFSERIFVMYAGRIAEKARVDPLLHNPLHPYTHALLQGTSDPDANNALSFKEVPPGEPPSLIIPPPGCRFHPRCAKAIAGLCEVEEPPEYEPETGHFVSCWLYKE